MSRNKLIELLASVKTFFCDAEPDCYSDDNISYASDELEYPEDDEMEP